METTLEHLPEEIWQIIIGYIDASSRRNLSVMNTYFNRAVKIHLRKRDHWMFLPRPHKVTRPMWRSLQSRRSVKVLLRLNYSSPLRDPMFPLYLVVRQLSNISALSFAVTNLTTSTVKRLSSYRTLHSLNELEIIFHQSTWSALGILHLLVNKLRKLSLSGIVYCNVDVDKNRGYFTTMLKGFVELNSLCLDLNYGGIISNGAECIYALDTLFSFEYQIVPCVFKTLENLQHLSLTNVRLDYSQSICIAYLTSLKSLTLTGFGICLTLSNHNFFRGLQHLTKLILQEGNEEMPGNQDHKLLRDLPPSLVYLSLYGMNFTNGFHAYLKLHGKNLTFLELDNMHFSESCPCLLNGLPEICPNLQHFRYRNNYFEAGRIMISYEIKHLQGLKVLECAGCEDVDKT